MSDDHKRFSLDTDITGTEMFDVTLQIDYILGRPNHFKAKLTFDDKMYEVVAIVNIEEKAFSVDLKAPNMEQISLSGQFGSTTFKTLYSLKHGRYKRDLSLQYSSIGDGFHLEFLTPVTRIKRMSLTRGSDSRSFSFEVDGSEDFAIGVQYDLANYSRVGDVRLSVRYPERAWQYLISLNYDIPQSLSAGLNGKFLLKSNHSEILSAKLSRTVGSTFLELSTPFQGWRRLQLNVNSDWKSVAEIRFQRDSRMTHIHLEQHGLYDYNIFFKTPFKGYENIAINSRKSQEKILIQIKNANVLISEISVMVHIDDISRAMGNLEVRWDAAQNIFIHIKTSFNGVRLTFSADTSFEQVKNILLEISIQKSGIQRKTKGKFNFNEFFLEYESLLLWSDTEIESNALTREI